MRIESVKLAYFSPTGTSRAVAEGIVRGLGHASVDVIDATTPDVRTRALSVSANELLVVAVPVYMGRVPDLLSEWLGAIHADGSPAVCVVVYGNRAYDNALLELRDVLSSRGCVPIAGAAFIGEHSFSDAGAPVALGRPNAEDTLAAVKFGETVADKLRAISSASDAGDLAVPGTHPYGGITKLWDVDFIAVGGNCGGCGLCASVCPTGAVDAADPAKIDIAACVTCCACIKRCPQGARSKKAGPVTEAQTRLRTLYAEPKSPEFFV